MASVAELYEYAMLPEHMESPDPSVGPSSITETGALMCSSGSKTGRVPKDKRIVLDKETEEVSTRAMIDNQNKIGRI
jgi:ATP-dependent phosphoenolpyruvate carboxykinase